MPDNQEPRHMSLSYLRAFVTLLVVAHHTDNPVTDGT